jgi:hypothetical protein
MQRLFLIAITGVLAGASMLGMTQTPASAGGLSIYFGAPPVYVPYDNWRYHHDRYYHDGYDRWHHRDYGGYRHDYHGYGYGGYGGYRHEDRGYHGDHGRHH